MADILLITDQPRLRHILAAVCTARGDRLRVAGSINQGVEELAFHPPGILFVQEHLAGFGREILVPHLTAALGSHPATLVLIGSRESDRNAPPLICLDPTLPDPELSAALARITAGNLPADAPETVPASAQPQTDAPPSPPPPGLAGLAGTINDQVSVPPGPAVKKRGIDFEQKLAELLRDHQDPPPPPGPEPVPPKNRHHPPAPLAWSRIILTGGILLATIAGITWSVLGRPGTHRRTGTSDLVIRPAPPPPHRQENVPSPAPPGTPGRLPSFIPAAQLDPLYGDEHPGWERYLTPATEFKLFREHGILRAIQVIDRSGKGIGDPLFSRVLMEMAGSSRYVVESRQQQDEFLLERGRVLPRTPLVIYRKLSDRSVKAFVLHMP